MRRKVRNIALGAGIAGILLSLIGAFINLDQFFQSYLVAVLFWLGIAMGSLVWLMVHFLSGGRWSLVIRRLLEAGAMTAVPMAALFVPLFFGLDSLYLWAHPEAVSGDELLLHKQPYLNVPFFVGRQFVYFILWIGMATLIYRWSHQEDERRSQSQKRTNDGASVATARLRTISGPGLLIYGFTITFASVDWLMSLEPHWFSTIFGVLVGTGQALTALAAAILVLTWLRHQEPLASVINEDRINSLANLLLSAVILWSYLAFMQYLIIWSGNIPEEVVWYMHRLRGAWQWVALFLLVFHFAVPFALLLMYRVKQQLRRLAGVAGLVLFANLVHLHWMVAPTFHPQQFHLHWMDIVTPIAVGGLWLATFVWLLGRRPLVAQNDPVMERLHQHG